jgi:hypothetical protein
MAAEGRAGLLPIPRSSGKFDAVVSLSGVAYVGLWRNVLVRRSQRAQVRWDRLVPLLNRWIPEPRILHPYPGERFDATHPR